MKKYNYLFLISVFILAFILGSCSKNLEESAKKMKESIILEGFWQYTYYEDKDTIITDIQDLPFIKFEGSTFVISKNEQIVQRGTYSVKLGNKYNKMNIKIISGENTGTVYKAIYKTVNDSLLTINYGIEKYPKDINLPEDGFIVKLEKIK
jgi:hypothetical protein